MERVLIKIHGIVQGVGFRPFIHKLVRDYNLSGFIENTSSGVELELEGERSELERFVEAVPGKAPALALIESIETEYGLPLAGFKGFEIKKSKTEEKRNTLISPDVCICEDCLRELMTPGDRRFRYPFINCTNCGPRFTIIKDVPYDRAKTSMVDFPMCPDCDREYHNIEDRRYHAQPDACPVCGPHCFYKAYGADILESDAAIEEARRALKAGKIIAVKGLGGMHLACLPEKAAELRRRKRRDEKPFALMCRNAECAEKLCFVSEEERAVLESFRRPIVLLRKKDGAPDGVSENRYIGIMLPYTPLHYLLFGSDIDALIMTSANISETPIMYKNQEAEEELANVADGFLLHNRDIQTRCDDSLCHVLNGKEYFLRRSRGYVPFPVKLGGENGELLERAGSVLALGAEQKASFCLNRGDYVFPCQHIGDLKNLETYEHYKDQIEHFKRLFDIEPKALACDLHPDYMSTEYALESGIRVFRIQHHHAHMASCMADNNLSGRVIGLVWDGTGLGTDGTSWGAECLVGGYESFERFGSIKPIRLIGGDRAVEDISRIAYYMLKKQGNGVYDAMLENGLNCPESTGMGRLFDGAAAVLGIRERAGYEGQAAVLLEAAADESIDGIYEYGLENNVFDWQSMISGLAQEKDVPAACAKFMNTLIDMALKQCLNAREKYGLERVVLSGGSFQNMYIMKRLPEKLRKEGFEVFRHQRVSCNDEGISLGQLMICASQYLSELNQ